MEPRSEDAMLRATHVVTCFLLRHAERGDEVFLVRRSQRVRTYRGAWAAISGYVEPGVTPLEQAYTEMHEEAGLDRSAVRLLREGEPVTFEDASIQQRWTVHPFLFALGEGEHPHTDWEATEHRWTQPAAVADLPTVPMLAEALARVYPPDGSAAADDSH